MESRNATKPCPGRSESPPSMPVPCGSPRPNASIVHPGQLIGGGVAPRYRTQHATRGHVLPGRKRFVSMRYGSTSCAGFPSTRRHDRSPPALTDTHALPIAPSSAHIDHFAHLPMARSPCAAFLPPLIRLSVPEPGTGYRLFQLAHPTSPAQRVKRTQFWKQRPCYGLPRCSQN